MYVLTLKKARKNGFWQGTLGFMPMKSGKSKVMISRVVLPRCKAMRKINRVRLY